MSGWDWGWDAFGAIATAGATMVALAAMPWTEWRSRRAVKRERREASAEVVFAAREAIALHAEMGAVVDAKHWDEDAMSRLRVRARHLEIALDRLIGKPGLTDGIIIVGAGAMAVTTEIANTRTLAEAFRHHQLRPEPADRAQAIADRLFNSPSVWPDARRIFDANKIVVEEIERRMTSVIRYHKLQE